MFILANLRSMAVLVGRKRQETAEKPRGDWGRIGLSVVCTLVFYEKRKGHDTSVIQWLMKYFSYGQSA